MTLSEYLDTLSDKKVAVLGIGVSNLPLLRLLAGRNINVTAYDRRGPETLGDTAAELRSLGVMLSLGDDYLRNLDADVIFRTPGMRPDLPELRRAIERGAVLTSEMEAFFEVCPCPIIAVTGSDGKTTTSTLIYEMLSRAGYTCHLGGNIGRPLLADADGMKPDEYAVVELSSFQLMTMKKSAGIAVVTNVAPNHLDIHVDMDEYVSAKRNIFAYQSTGDTVVLNADNDITRAFAEEANSRVLRFSKHPLECDGVYLENGAVWSRRGDVCEKVMETGDILLPGIHNAENYMAAITAVRDIVPPDVMRSTAREFRGVEHRMEFVRELHGVRFYNDSIATSPTRVIAGLRAFSCPVVLIAGGYDKHLSFEPMVPEIINHVGTLILCGATAGSIRAAVESAEGYDSEKLPILETDDFREAMELGVKSAKPGDAVLLSPACAAFDKFPNFMVRGEVFKDFVNGIAE